MTDEPAAEEMSTLTGRSRTLERAVHGMQMNAARLGKLLADDAVDHAPSPGLAALASALAGLSPADLAVVNAALSGRGRPKRKAK